MDYPAPLSTIDGARVDVSNAYAVGIGEWDKQAVRFGYSPDASLLPSILRENRERGLVYITDSDARSPGSASSSGVLWDNGSDPVAQLQSEMEVRRHALLRYGERMIRSGRPMATIEETLVPLYLKHRYQIEGTVRLVGGVSYSYALRDGGDALPVSVPGDQQLAALDAVLATLAPKELVLPQSLILLIPPRPPGYEGGRERFDRRTGPTFDPVSPAETAAEMVFGFLLDRERAARLVYQHDVSETLPGLVDVLRRTTESVERAAPLTEYEAEVKRAVQTAWVHALMALSADAGAAPAVRSRVDAELTVFARTGPRESPTRTNSEDTMHREWLVGQVQRYLRRDYQPGDRPETLTTPPGAPIGME
jgi:hypothetical protein